MTAHPKVGENRTTINVPFEPVVSPVTIALSACATGVIVTAGIAAALWQGFGCG
jgi:hypothetical protein